MIRLRYVKRYMKIIMVSPVTLFQFMADKILLKNGIFGFRIIYFLMRLMQLKLLVMVVQSEVRVRVGMAQRMPQDSFIFQMILIMIG